MQRRKYLAGLGSVAAGGAALMSTGAFEGAYVAAERNVNVTVADDANAFLQLKATSPYASTEPSGDGGSKLVVNLDGNAGVGGSGVNPDADTRLDDVFRVQNTTGSTVTLRILDGATTAEAVPDYGEGNPKEDAFQVYAAPVGSGGAGTRIDTGGGVSLEPGEQVSINLLVLLKESDPANLPEELLVVADGTS